MTIRNYKKMGLYCSMVVLACGLIACTPPAQTNDEVNKETTVVQIELEDKEEKVVDPADGHVSNREISVKTEAVKEKSDAYTIEIEMPILTGMKDHTFQEKENEALTESIMAYAENIKQMALDIEKEGYLTAPYYVGVDYSVLMQNEAYLSIVVNYNEYTGGAHGNYYADYIIYDLGSETRIRLKDIVKTDTDYMAVINEAVTEAIINKRQDSEYGEGLHSWYEGIEEEMLSFSLQPEGFGIHFQPYEIGPYAEGAPSFVIPYERLADILVLKDF